MLESRKRDIRKQAYALREKCKVSRYGIIDLFKECERLGYKLLRYPLGEEADLGFVMKKDNDIVIFTNTCSRLAREIFTLAHEIGHVVLHLERANSFIDDAITIAGRSTNEKEQEANYFASCLLMPEDEVDKFLDLIIADYKVLLGEISKLKDEVFSLKRENETLKADIRDKETVISIEKSKLAVLEKNKNYSAEQLDPIDLLQRCGKYEVKLSELGVDPSKIK